MKKLELKPGKVCVIVEVADIFLQSKGFEEIPDETLEPELAAIWKTAEDKATRQIFAKLTREQKKLGFKLKGVRSYEYFQKKGNPLALGLNGVYALFFVKN